MKKLLFALLAAILLIACQKNGDDSIELTGGTSTSQKIYADETQKSEGIKFTAKESWKATVTEVKAKSGNDVEWLKLSATEGGAGDFTISMTLTTNTTGEDRKAEIKIISGGTSITIVVEQKGTTQNGEKPETKLQKVTKIETELCQSIESSNDGTNSYKQQYYKAKMLFTYDSKDRVSKIEGSGEDAMDDSGKLTTHKFSTITNVIYAENSITIDHVSNGILEYREVATLANGKVTKIQSYNMQNGVAMPDLSYTMSYVNDSLISAVIPRSDKSYKYTQSWKGGNVVELKYTTEGYYGSDNKLTYYTDRLNNKSNVDLSWLFLGQLSEGFASISAGGLLNMLGYCGQRTKDLVKVVEDGSIKYSVEYAFANEYITTINIANESDKKYVHKHVITY